MHDIAFEYSKTGALVKGSIVKWNRIKGGNTQKRP